MIKNERDNKTVLHQVISSMDYTMQLQSSYSVQGEPSSVEAGILEEIVLVVVTDWLHKWECLLHVVAATELDLSHHVGLWSVHALWRERQGLD